LRRLDRIRRRQMSSCQDNLLSCGICSSVPCNCCTACEGTGKEVVSIEDNINNRVMSAVVMCSKCKGKRYGVNDESTF
jgi:hypothetical protein